MQEPSVLDFVKSRFHHWRRRLQSSDGEVEDEILAPDLWRREAADAVAADAAAPRTVFRFAWPVLLILSMGLWAQLALEPRTGGARGWQFGFMLYLLTALVLLALHTRGGWALQPWAETMPAVVTEPTFLRSAFLFLISLVFALVAFIAFTGGLFTPFNVITWLVAIVTMVLAFWRPPMSPLAWLRDSFGRPQWNIPFTRSAFVALAVISLILFFRVYRLADVPSQSISDHAEKLLDVGDVLNGKTPVFFQRNTGREFFQFYLTAAIIRLFDTGLTYMSLKIGTVLCGLVTLIYIYLLGKEMGSARIGLLAVVLAGIAYWPNIISRYGLRFPIYPLFYAPALYYLVWGLRTRNRFGFILSGLFLGLGLHGYSPYRVVPFVIVAAVGLYLLHKQSEGYREQAVWGLFIVAMISFIVFLPLLRYMIENPTIVFYRAMTRLGDVERPLPGEPWMIFLYNLRNALTMFGWDDGEIWPISVPHRPVLDVVTAVFFHLGVVLMVIRYIRQRHWLDLFTLVSIPMLMLPSILSLTFPNENPSLNRTAAAIVPVFLIAGLAFDAFLRALESASESIWNQRFAWAIGGFLLLWASLQNYDLVFNQYRKLYDLSAWNTTELGAVVRSFETLTGSADTAWLVGYPHWADSRLVMINAGHPFKDNAIWPQNFEDTLADRRPKLFLININDTDDVEALQSLYPQGWLKEYQSKYATKNFLIFFVPAQETPDR